MELIDILGLLLENYASATVLSGFIVLKGCASVVANNFNTEDWKGIGKAIDWLASNNKKAKLTGTPAIDAQIESRILGVKPKGLIRKVLKFLS